MHSHDLSSLSLEQQAQFAILKQSIINCKDITALKSLLLESIINNYIQKNIYISLMKDKL